MRLLQYCVTVPVFGAMDRYYNLMFNRVLPFIDSSGTITSPAMPKMNLNRLTNVLKKLSSEQKDVTWVITVENRKTQYRFTCKNGEVKYVRLNKDGGG